MIKDLFVNLSILSFFILIGGYALRDRRLYDNDISLGLKLVIGMAGGILGILIMIYTIEIERGGPILDLRFIALMIIFYHAGAISSFITATIISMARIMVYGVNESSIVAVMTMATIIIVFILINKLRFVGLKKWVSMHCAGTLISVTSYYYLIANHNGKVQIILSYILISTISSTLIYILIQYIRGMNSIYQELKSHSTLDFLTGLINTREFDSKLSKYTEKSEESNRDLSCIMIDIDYFKKINDTYGHDAGDVVIKTFATILKENCRGKDVVARVGGEEFCILLIDSDGAYAIEVANRILNEVRKSKFKINKNTEIFITASAGVSVYNEGTEAREDFVKEADLALYAAKQNGRNKVCSYKNFYNEVKKGNLDKSNELIYDK